MQRSTDDGRCLVGLCLIDAEKLRSVLLGEHANDLTRVLCPGITLKSGMYDALGRLKQCFHKHQMMTSWHMHIRRGGTHGS